MKHSIHDTLTHISPVSLSAREQDKTWNTIHSQLEARGISKNPRRYGFSAFKKSIALTLIFGLTAGTAFAADSAKPGDALFPIDRALENLQLSVASDTKQQELKMKFALERVSEVKDILEEVASHKTQTEIKAAPEETPQAQQKSVESLVSPEEPAQENEEPQNNTPDEQQLPTSNEVEGASETNNNSTPPKEVETASSSDVSSAATASTSDEALSEGVETLSGEDIEAIEETLELNAQKALNSSISQTDKKRIEIALGTALSFLGDIKGELSEQGNTYAVEYIDLMLEEINNEIGGLPTEVAFEVNLSASREKVKFEITSTTDAKPKLQIAVDTTKEELVETPESPQPKKAKPKAQATKLQIKDGGITLTTAQEESYEGADQKEAGTTNSASSSESDVPESSVATGTPAQKEEETVSTTPDSTTTVKVIFQKLDEDFEISVTDQNATIHEIIEQYTEEPSKETIDMQ